MEYKKETCLHWSVELPRAATLSEELRLVFLKLTGILMFYTGPSHGRERVTESYPLHSAFPILCDF